MPFLNGRNSFSRGRPNQNRSAADIEKKSQAQPPEAEQPPANGRQSVKLAQEERDHQTGLKRAYAAARIMDTNLPRADRDNIPMLAARNPQPAKTFNRDS